MYSSINGNGHSNGNGNGATIADEVVITGLGVVSPVGIGWEAYWASLLGGQSGVRPLTSFDSSSFSVKFGGEVVGFDPKEFIRPRKSLKVMCRDIQLGVSAADMALSTAGLAAGQFDPERMGVVYGSDMTQCDPEDVAAAYRDCVVDGKFDVRRWGTAAFNQIYPLWMLKYLPNMPACHVAIAHDARGPNNSLTLGDVSGLLAVAEAVRIIQRGRADVMVAGGTSSRVHPTIWVRNTMSEMSTRGANPAAASRPFDADRDGAVFGEGAAAIVLERRAFAEARGAKILARVLGYASTFEPRNGKPFQGKATRSAIRSVLSMAHLAPDEVGHVNAHGQSTIHDDRAEAAAIRDVLGDVPVTAPKGHFGNLGVGSGVVEMLASVLAVDTGLVPPTLNYERPDPECPVNVVRGQPLAGTAPTAVILNHAVTGQAAAVALASA